MDIFTSCYSYVLKVPYMYYRRELYNTYVAIPSLINTQDRLNSREADTNFLLATFRVSVTSKVRLSILT